MRCVVLLIPLSFIPFLNTFISASLDSLTLAKKLHQPVSESLSPPFSPLRPGR